MTAVVMAVAGVAHAQPALVPLNSAAPFAAAPVALSPAQLTVSYSAAQRAHDLGFLSIAANSYRQLLTQPGANQATVALSLAGVHLDAGEPAEAEKVLAALPEPRSAAWRLRAGLAALQLRKREAAQAEWDAIRADEIPEADRPWYHYFTGALYDTATPRQERRANEFYILAESAAPTDFARARFQLAAERVRLRESGAPTREALDAVKRWYDQAQGRELSYEPARQYAVMLALLQRGGEAVQFLRQNVLLTMPPQEKGWRDEFNFLVGVLGDRTRNGAGRLALVQLVSGGVKAQRQRQALQLLADASAQEPERGHFRSELNRLLEAKPAHSLRETLLYFRAQLALGEKDYPSAERNAKALVDEFPTSALRLHAFGVLTQSAWEQQRYRLAAANARSALALLSNSTENADSLAATRTDLGVLEAEAWFRLGEYRNAADGYAAVLQGRPVGMPVDRLSSLLYQRVLAEIRADPQVAQSALDEIVRDRNFSVNDRWEAEWHLARQLQVRGRIDEAYSRVGRLLGASSAEAGPQAALRPDLRLRLAWLHAKLAFDADKLEPAMAHVEELLATLKDVDGPLRTEVASTAVLLRAQAELNLRRESAALATLKRLREEFPASDAAVRSYLVEADYYSQQEKLSEAQVRLTTLTDNPAYAKNQNVPYALFQLALLSERLGQERDLEEANRRIEQLVNLETAVREPDLVFAARLKQGDLLRRLSQFPQAQRAYEYLVNNYGQRADIVLAQLALADCHSAQAAADPTHAESAQLIYEELRDRVDAPVDVRVEAGYKLGYLLARRGQHARATDVWWKDVVDPFLRQNKQPMSATDKRPFWLARTLFNLAQVHEERERWEEARECYRLLIETKLGIGENLAKEALKRLGVPEARL